MSGKALNLQTKKLIAETLYKKLCKKTVESITVAEIVSDCGISRHTFYYHFSNIYEAIHWMYQQKANEFLSRDGFIESWETCIQSILEFVRDNRAACESTLKSELCQTDVLDFFGRIVAGSIGNMVREILRKNELVLDTKTTEFFCQCYAISMTAILSAWFDGKMEYSIEELIRMMGQTMERQIEFTLLHL